MSRVILNVATGGYVVGQKRLRESLEKYDGTHVLFWDNTDHIDSPPHYKNPYAFKIYAIDFALKNGYKQILWLDASVYAIKKTKPVWDAIEKEGYIMQYAGHNVGEWTNDRALEYFNISRDEAMNMPMYGNAGFLGLNFDFEIARTFFEKWKESMLAGMFIGEWNNNNKTESKDGRCRGHRHDMCCGSICANQLGMKYKKGNEWLQYAAPEDKPLNNKIIFKAQGI